MLVIDEYLAVDVVLGDWPAGLPDDDTLALPASRYFRILQRIHQPGGGQLTAALDRLSPAGRQAMRYPHPEVLQILDPRKALGREQLRDLGRDLDRPRCLLPQGAGKCLPVPILVPMTTRWLGRRGRPGWAQRPASGARDC